MIRGLCLLGLALPLGALGCGGATSQASPEIVPEAQGAPMIGRERTPVAEPPINLRVRTTDGRWIELAQLRGRCALLFLFATFDGASQASLRPLGAFVQAHPEVSVLGLAVEESPAELADAWQHALTPPFPIAYDPTRALLLGASPLGRIESVPRFRLLDAQGRPVGEHVGYPYRGALEALLSAGHCPAR